MPCSIERQAELDFRFHRSAMGHGGWVVRSGTDDQEALRALQQAIDLGVNFIDTALAYGNALKLIENRATLYH